jgi:hypothetical protein
LLDELAAYRTRGRFPKIRDFRARVAPVFVDDECTRCAVRTARARRSTERTPE